MSHLLKVSKEIVDVLIVFFGGFALGKSCFCFQRVASAISLKSDEGSEESKKRKVCEEGEKKNVFESVEIEPCEIEDLPGNEEDDLFEVGVNCSTLFN